MGKKDFIKSNLSRGDKSRIVETIGVELPSLNRILSRDEKTLSD